MEVTCLLFISWFSTSSLQFNFLRGCTFSMQFRPTLSMFKIIPKKLQDTQIIIRENLLQSAFFLWLAIEWSGPNTKCFEGEFLFSVRHVQLVPTITSKDTYKSFACGLLFNQRICCSCGPFAVSLTIRLETPEAKSTRRKYEKCP